MELVFIGAILGFALALQFTRASPDPLDPVLPAPPRVPVEFTTGEWSEVDE